MLIIKYLQGVSYDHIELNFYLNGKFLDVPVTGVKGTVYPILFGKFRSIIINVDLCQCYKSFNKLVSIIFVSVDDGAILDLILSDFVHSPPSGFEKIMIEQSLL